jgi:hypothetical protein
MLGIVEARTYRLPPSVHRGRQRPCKSRLAAAPQPEPGAGAEARVPVTQGADHPCLNPLLLAVAPLPPPPAAVPEAAAAAPGQAELEMGVAVPGVPGAAGWDVGPAAALPGFCRCAGLVAS